MAKMMMALAAVAAIGLAQPTMALAHGGHGGGGGSHGGGFHGGFAGGFHGGFHRHGFVGFGVGPYAYYDGYPYYYDGGCAIVRQRVLTRFGWRIRPVQVCG